MTVLDPAGVGFTITHTKFAILDAFDVTGERTTREIRERIGGDPHPVLGRMVQAGWIGNARLDYWQLTELGRLAWELGNEERKRLVS